MDADNTNTMTSTETKLFLYIYGLKVWQLFEADAKHYCTDWKDTWLLQVIGTLGFI